MSVGPQRGYGFYTGLYVVVASMVGAGILTSSGYTLRETGNPWSLLGLWAVGGVMALAGALTIAELTAARPALHGVESTVVTLREECVWILRSGPVTAEDLLRVARTYLTAPTIVTLGPPAP